LCNHWFCRFTNKLAGLLAGQQQAQLLCRLQAVGQHALASVPGWLWPQLPSGVPGSWLPSQLSPPQAAPLCHRKSREQYPYELRCVNSLAAGKAGPACRDVLNIRPCLLLLCAPSQAAPSWFLEHRLVKSGGCNVFEQLLAVNSWSMHARSAAHQHAEVMRRQLRVRFQLSKEGVCERRVSDLH
jgi:hypothetical protein